MFLENKNLILRSKCFQKNVYFSQLGNIYPENARDLDYMISKGISQTLLSNPKHIFKKRKKQIQVTIL